MILYQGPSQLDGSPIVVIATGLDRKSDNPKTGNAVQTWILRQDMDPTTASRTGADFAICGDCPHRGTPSGHDAGVASGRSCYVLLHTAPLGVWKTWQAGRYAWPSLDDAAAMLRGKMLRLGSYGDPAAVPYWVWAKLCPAAAAVSGYTHQWRQAPELAQWCMASVDREAEVPVARFLGFRTFRVRTAAEPLAQGEVVCPASGEYEERAGKRSSCAACRMCGGNSAKAKVNIAIIAHGTPGTNFRKVA